MSRPAAARGLALASLMLAASSTAHAQSSSVTGIGATITIDFRGGWTQDRQDTLEDAALYWADRLTSSVDIEISVGFQEQFCNVNSGVLGSAGTITVEQNFPNAPLADTYYPQALVNAFAGTDRNGGTAEITSTFNSALDDPNRESDCLNGADWHYGTTAPPSGTFSLYEVALHEFAHGLGVATLANMSTGQLFMGDDDVYTRQLEDNSLGLSLDAASMTNAQRAAAATDDGDLIWTGAEVTAATDFLTAGTIGDEAMMYAPTTFAGGSSVSHFDTRLAPNELMEPSYNATTRKDLTVALLYDLGWVPANDTPVITAQAALSTDEDVPLQITLADLTVTDSDNVYPTDFTLTVQGGTNYSVSGTTITPDQDFNGTLTVPVTVNDGTDDSDPFDLTVTVDAVNDPPVITGQASLATDEDTPILLELADLTFGDVDSASGFSLTVQAGADYAVSGDEVTPDPDFSGTLFVSVVVSDGTDDSAPFDVEVTVNPINDAPVITGPASLSTPEDTPLVLALTDLVVDDVDNAFPADFSLAIDPGANYSVSGGVITPAPEFSGTLTVPVTVNDGDLDSAAFSLTIEVTPVNDPPVITAQSPLSTSEDVPIALSIGDVTVADPDGGPPTLVIASGANYTFAGTTVTPAADFNGALTVRVRANDGSQNGPIFNLTVSVTPVNDAPVITGPSMTLSTPEETGLTLSAGDLLISDPDDTTFTLRVSAGPNHAINGSTITPIADFNGTLIVPVTVNDGEVDSAVFDLSVEVTPVNDAPIITAADALTTDEDTPLAIEPDDLQVEDPDDDYPSDFTLRARPGANYAIAGDATIEPDEDFNGNLSVEVVVNDGDVDSPPFLVRVTVTPVNDAPVITAQSDLEIDEDTAYTVRVEDLVIDDPDDAQFTLAVQPGANHAASGATFTPSPDFTGELTVAVTANDGEADSEPFDLTVVVRPINDPPTITAQVDLTTDEDVPLSLSASDFTLSDPDDPLPSLSLEVRPGLRYTVDGLTITPEAHFFGQLEVEVVAVDAEGPGPIFNAVVDVTSVNDAPEIRGQRPVTALEGQARTISSADLEIFDPDDGLFTVRVSPGANYAAEEDRLTPDVGFTGVLTAEVVVTDGEDDSAPFPLQVSVSEAPLEEVVDLDATGLFTPRPSIPAPPALGLLSPPVTVTLATAPEYFRPGRHFITWRETDASGAEAFRDQQVDVHPRVSIAPGGDLAEGTTAEVRFVLNGAPPESPFPISYAVGGSASALDHDLEPDVVQIPEGATEVSVPFEVFSDGDNDDGEVLEVRVTIVRNARSEPARFVLRDQNVAPRVRLAAEQAGAARTSFISGDGAAQLFASVVDEEPVTYDWSFPADAVVNDGSGPQPAWSDGAAGAAEVTVRVTDARGAATARSLFVAWRPSAPVLSETADTDGDGQSDALEGAGDADLDGFDDHRDFWSLPFVQPVGETASGPAAAGRVVEATPGVRLTRGLGSRGADAPGVGLSAQALGSVAPVDTADAYVEVWATELSQAGLPVDFVVPLERPLADGDTVRVLTAAGWFDFLPDGDDALASAPRIADLCPPPDDAAYATGGLRAGDDCVRLTIQDGDVNDADGDADGQIHLVAAREPQPASTAPTPDAGPGPTGPDAGPPGGGQIAAVSGDCSCRGTGGATGPSSLLVGLFAVALLGLGRRSRRPGNRTPGL